MAQAVPVQDLFAGKKILLGGIGPTIEVESFTETELDLLNKFIDEVGKTMREVSPYLANLFFDHRDLIRTFGEIFKAKVKQTFGGEAPTPNSFGIGLLAPYDLHYTDTPSAEEPAYTAYGPFDWKLTVSQGTPIYVLGDGANFFRMSPTVGKRALAVIFQNGFVEIGTTPSFNQFLVKTEKVNYAPWRAHTIQDQPIDPRKPIYVYHTPFVIPLWYDYGVMLSAMPTRSGTSDFRLFGVVFYEYGYHSQLKPAPSGGGTT